MISLKYISLLSSKRDIDTVLMIIHIKLNGIEVLKFHRFSSFQLESTKQYR